MKSRTAVNKGRLLPRQGLRIRSRGADPEVRTTLIQFARWLRSQYDFPIRVPVYLYPSEMLLTMHGKRVSASFFAPWSRRVEPFIRIAAGEYLRLKKEWGREYALASHLISLAHEVIHYLQWVETGETWERGVASRARAMVRRYYTDHSAPLAAASMDKGGT